MTNRLEGKCEECGTIFLFLASRKTHRFCSHPCYSKFRSKEMLSKSEENFWSKLNKTDGCWEWTGYPSTKFGYCRYNKKLIHRMAWELTFGPIPEGMFVLHKCDNPKCAKPDHLFIGTQKENVADMFKKGRAVIIPKRGEHNGVAKLKDSEVEEIRKSFSEGFAQYYLAERFHVSRAQISRIVNNKSR